MAGLTEEDNLQTRNRERTCRARFLTDSCSRTRKKQLRCLLFDERKTVGHSLGGVVLRRKQFGHS